MEERDNPFASVGAIVLKGSKVLLVRHTYGGAAGKLLNPGGMLREGEMPYAAAVREVLEETGVTAVPQGVLALRCSANGWYLVLLCAYESGKPRSDGAENSEALFMEAEEALAHPQVTETAKALLRDALKGRVIPLRDARKGRVVFCTADLP